MAADLRMANAQVSRAVDAVAARCNSGFFDVYAGTIPTDANTAIGAQTKLARIALAASAFAAAVNGVATLAAVAVVQGLANGTAAWFRAFESDGVTAVFDDTVGTSGEGINFDSTTIASGGNVTLTSYTLTLPKT